ncbi:MAG: LacI family DNA-binding transcriptional regulator, partial [Vicinamibacteria bacterium]|nr:LacI family DNA-binding transcriptional regulator [Vicinamibacteria bacterium]
MPITIKDIAAMAKVSQGTVSKVLNETPGVGAETRKRILKLIEKLDYQPNSSAQSLATRKTGSVGVIIPHTGSYSMSSDYWPILLTSITEKAAAQGLNVVLSTARSEEDVDSAYKSILRGRRVDGLIVSAEQFGQRQLAELLFKGFPFVMVGRSPFLASYYVDVDNSGGSSDMTRHLIDLNHRRIMMLAGPEHYPSVKDRVEGFRSAMAAAGCAPIVHHFAYDDENASEKIKRLFDEQPRPTAAFIAAGDLATAAIRATTELGLAIPSDLALVVFDDHPLYQYFSPAITAVSQPIHELGQTAVDLLFALMDGREPEEKRRILQTRLVIRGSCGTKL